MLEDEYITSWMKERENERIKKRRQRQIYINIKLYDVFLNLICCILGMITGSNKFYIAALVCIISYLVMSIIELLK